MFHVKHFPLAPAARSDQRISVTYKRSSPPNMPPRRKRTSAKTEAASASADDDRPRHEKPAPLGTGARVSACDFRSASHTTIYVGNFIPLSPEAASPKVINFKASSSEDINTLPLNHSVKRESRTCRLEKYGSAPRNEKSVKVALRNDSGALSATCHAEIVAALPALQRPRDHATPSWAS